MYESIYGSIFIKGYLHPFVDIFDDNKNKCVCIFSDPLFYKKLLKKTATLIGILEYVVEERDCAIFRANKAAQTVLGEWRTSLEDTNQSTNQNTRAWGLGTPLTKRGLAPVRCKRRSGRLASCLLKLHVFES